MDIKLSYTEKGKGEPLILLHGNGENSTYFVNQIDYFSKTYRVIAIDTRGHGKSPRGEAPFTIQQFAEDLHEFMDEQSIDQANLLGFSDGANIALVFALKYQERVRSLILNGGNLNPKGVKASVQIPIVIGYKIARFFSKRSKQAGINVEMLELMVSQPNINALDLKVLKIRTLVIAGTKDMIKDEHTRFIHNHIANSELVILEGNHFIANKKPEEFNREVERFLSLDSSVEIGFI